MVALALCNISHEPFARCFPMGLRGTELRFGGRQFSNLIYGESAVLSPEAACLLYAAVYHGDIFAGTWPLRINDESAPRRVARKLVLKDMRTPRLGVLRATNKQCPGDIFA